MNGRVLRIACAALALLAWRAIAEADVEAIAARALPAVILIHGTRADTGARVQGSGCVVHPDGYVLATAHQAEGVRDFEGQFADGTRVPLSLVRSEPAIEYALFKTDRPLPAHAPIGDALTVRSGAPIVSIASPRNLEFATVSGTVSNPSKEYNGYPVLLVSLTATHGSSGGPVFDREGRLIGLISGGLTEVDFTIVNKINNAYPLLKSIGARLLGDDFAEAGRLVPAPGASEAELRAIDAYNRGVSADGVEEKIAAYGLATTLLPAFFEAHFNLALAESSAGDLEAAAKAYLRADALRPDSVAVKRNLGRLYLRARQYEDAAAVFAEALRLAPEDARSHNDLGEAHRRAGKHAEAIRHFRDALRLNDSAPGVHYNLALSLSAQGEAAQAIRHFEAYLALSPGAEDTAEVRAWIEKLKQ
ncbi:MAG: serine protease [Candidatus Hydrogenedentes bacterium]|nr:serine protease [Candidatus Hydrogenedentota bacterium]